MAKTPESWEVKRTAIREAWDHEKAWIDENIGYGMWDCLDHGIQQLLVEIRLEEIGYVVE